MLILQIALGIVLAVILLAFLPQILSIGIWLVVAIAAVAVVGAAIYFMFEYIEYIVAALALFIGVALLVRKTDVVNLDEEKKRRKALGYDD